MDNSLEQSVYQVGFPNIGNRDALIARVNSILNSRWLTNNGVMVQEFESRIAEYVQVKHAVVVNNATIGLEIAVKALGLNGEVIVPSFTFVATAHALSWVGITPVFADIDERTHNLDPVSVESLITPRTTGIVGVHLWGRGCDTDALEAIAARHGIEIIYDAAHAFGCSRNGKMIGGFGRCEVFSFHATKFVNSFEGGAIVTNDGELARRCRLMRNFGIESPEYVVTEGTNAKMPEVCAAMGLTSLEAIDEIVCANRRNYHTYRRALKSVKGCSLIGYDESERNNFQYIVVEIDQQVAGIDRDSLLQTLRSERIMARKYFWPGCHRLESYSQERTTQTDPRLPNTDKIASRVLVLPTGQAIVQKDAQRVAETIATAIRK
jgi:dTDP-4-amino-4,6-dideoxygalactose transaminase